jgi:hypothetical protein
MQRALIIMLKNCMMPAQSWVLHQYKVVTFIDIIRLLSAYKVPGELIKIYGFKQDPILDNF